jgi:hypothetical protein
MMEYFPASGHRPPLHECLAKVDDSDVVVVLVAYRYGWVPPDQPAAGEKSISWLECERAMNRGIEVLAFIVDKTVDWPVELRETYRITAAIDDGTDSPELLTEVKRNKAKLEEFKRWLERGRIRATFGSVDDLRAKVESSLREWRVRHATFQGTDLLSTSDSADSSRYLEFLRDQTAWIDI